MAPKLGNRWSAGFSSPIRYERPAGTISFGVCDVSSVVSRGRGRDADIASHEAPLSGVLVGDDRANRRRVLGLAVGTVGDAPPDDLESFQRSRS